MKKVFFTLLLLIACFLTGNAASKKGAVMLQTPYKHEVNAVSPNAKWACGMFFDGSTNRGFIWNLETNEVTYLGPKGYTSEAWGVSDNGVVCGMFVSTQIDGGPCTTGGYWKDGKLHLLKDENGNPVHSDARTITPDGQYIAGTLTNGSVSSPCVWKNGILERRLEAKDKKGNDCTGIPQVISDDGQLVAGYYMYNNRIPCYWKPELVQLSTGRSFDCETSAMSPNKRYLLARDAEGTFIHDMQTGERTDIPWIDPDKNEFGGGLQIFDDKTAIIFETPALAFYATAYVYKDENNYTTVTKWMKDNWNAAVPESYTDPSVTRFSRDMKTMITLSLNGADEYGQALYCGVAFISDREINIARPVTLKAKQMEATRNILLNWTKPAANETSVTAYRIYRDNQKIGEVGPGELGYSDKNATVAKHTYQVSALYQSEESEKISVEVDVKDLYYAPAAGTLSTYQTNGKNVVLDWSKPNTGFNARLKLHNDLFALPFGVNTEMTYWAAVKFNKNQVNCYAGNFEIKGIEFYPCQKVEKLTLSLSSKGQKLTEQVIDQTKLVFGQSNVVLLNTPVSLPADGDITATLKIEQTTPGNSIGLADEPVVEGGNLISEDGTEWTTLDVLSEGAYTYNWMIGMMLDSKEKAGSPEITGYNIYRDDEKIAETAPASLGYGDTNVNPGLHVYGVEAIYNSSIASARKTSELFAREKNTDNCQAPVNLNGISEYGYMRLTWDMPENTEVGYTNWEYMQGTGYQSIDSWYYGVSFSAEKMRPLAGSKIARVNFLPLSQEVNYSIVIFENGTEIYNQGVEVPQENVGKVNRIKLADPVQVKPYTEYTLAIRVSNSLNIRSVGVSVGSTYEGGMLFSEAGDYFTTPEGALETGNLMISMDVEKIAPRFNPGMTYKVYVDDVAEPQTVTENYFTKSTAGTTEIKTVSLKVAAIYPNGEKMSEATTVTIDPAGISTEETVVVKVYPNPATSYVNIEGNVTSATLFDMSGREVTRIENANSMEVGSYAAGSYLLRSVIDGKAYTNKIQLVK